MSLRKAVTRTEHGPVQYTLMVCDGPTCGSAPVVQEAAVSWISTQQVGLDVQTFSSVDLRGKLFCSVECLRKYLAV